MTLYVLRRTPDGVAIVLTSSNACAGVPSAKKRFPVPNRTGETISTASFASPCSSSVDVSVAFWLISVQHLLAVRGRFQRHEMIVKECADFLHGKPRGRQRCNGCREYVLHALPDVNARIDAGRRCTIDEPQ